MNTACPTDDRLKQLIQEAFSDSIAPDTTHLQKIESRLTNKISRSKRNAKPSGTRWLIWLFLAFSATAAAWWGIEQIFEAEKPDTANAQEFTPDPQTTPLSHAPAENQPVTEPEQSTQTNDKRSPIIFKRERY